MITIKEKFLIDSNSLITPYKMYYPFDFARKFWDQLFEKIKNQDVFLLDLVKEELIIGDDDLSKWVASIDSQLIIDRRDPRILVNYSDVLAHLQTSGLYQEKALATWSQAHIADPWLIATARTYGLTVITLEKPKGGLNVQNKVGSAKIPDVCNVFDVQCKDLFYMMRSLSFMM